MSLYLSHIDLYLFANPTSRLYSSMFFSLFQYIPYLFIVPLYLFISLCQYKFTAIYCSYVHLYSFLSLLYPPLFLYISLSTQIHDYIFQTRFLYLTLFFVYQPIFVSYPPLFLYISLSIPIDAYLFKLQFLYFSIILVYPPISIFIYFLSTIVSFYFLFIQIYIYLFESSSSYVTLSLVL